MTDEERVTDLFGRLLANGVELDDRELDAIDELLAAVRLDERRAIVTALVAQYGASCRATGGLFTGEAFLRAVESIERGEHAS